MKRRVQTDEEDRQQNNDAHGDGADLPVNSDHVGLLAANISIGYAVPLEILYWRLPFLAG